MTHYLRRALLAVILLVAVVGASACGAPDSDKADRIQSAGVLRVGTEGVYAPFSYHDESGQLVGYDVDIAKAVGAKLGVPVEFVETPWDSMFAALEANRFDIVANQVTINDERKAKYDLSDPYAIGQGVIVTRADDNSIKSLADLKGKVAAENPTSNWAQLARDNGARVESVDGFAQAIKLLNQGRVDVVVNDSIAVYQYLAETGDKTVKIAAETSEKSEQGFAARKDSGLLPELNKALKDLGADGELATISREVPEGRRLRSPAQQGSRERAARAPLEAHRGQPVAVGQGRHHGDHPADDHQLHRRPGDRSRCGVGPAVEEPDPLQRRPVLHLDSSAAPRCWCSCSSCSSRYREFGIKIDPFPAAVIAFSLNVGGYAAEIIRSAIQSIPKGQWEAAETIGFNYVGALRRIILPQAARVAVPPLSNTLISLVKDTSLASTILVTELLRTAQIVAAPTFEFFALYGTAAVLLLGDLPGALVRPEPP